MRRRIVVIGAPEGRRVPLLQEALAARGAPPAVVLSHAELLADPTRLAPALSDGALLRIESPERDFATERGLIALGADEPDDEAPDATRVGREAAERLEFDRGRILYPRQWYLGFRALLRRIDRDRAEAPAHEVMNHPEDIAVMFDKPTCHDRFVAGGVPCPTGLGTPRGYDDLRARMAAAGLSRVFVKLASGSSASGVVALAVGPGRVQARTTVEVVNQKGGALLYNTRAIRLLDAERAIAGLIDNLCRERAQAERWVPKATLPGGAFDLRVVVIGGRARHRVARISRTPMTYLHLLNHRGDAEAARARMSPDAWASALGACERAASLFPRCLYAGVDLVVAAGFRRHAVLEINAFGDLLPGLLHGGQTTHAAELDAAGIDGEGGDA